MPKDTFFNLPETKKDRIVDAALEEFSAHSYHKARVTAIAKKASIAMGSFYQYFADKKDLFKYIIDQSVNKKLEYINRDIIENKEKYTFFEILRETYLSGIRFAKDNPRLVTIGNYILNNKELQKEIWKDQEDKSIKFFQRLLKDGIKKGELNPEIDVNLISQLLLGLNYTLSDIIYKDGKIDPDNLKNEMEIIDKMLYFIKNGIKKDK